LPRVFANGINIKLASALTERFLLSRINTKMVDPGSRVYQREPINEVKADLGKYIAACLIIARAYLVANKPEIADRIVVAGFEEWECIVQSPLMWLGTADPRGNRDQLRSVDPTRDELVRLLQALRIAFKDQGTAFKVADCTKLAEEMNYDLYGRPTGGKYPELRELMLTKGRVDGRAFGQLLGRHLDRVDEEGWSIGLAHESKKRGNTYRLISPKASQNEPKGATEEEEPL
jgi:hypothetical protein